MTVPAEARRFPWGRDDTGCSILHVDMDAFFAAVEVRARPELAGLPVIVGHRSGRGVVTSATYEARVFGVRSAMPIGQAQRLCPQGIFVEPTRGAYQEASEQVMKVLGDFTPIVEQVSVDEAFLDISGAAKSLGSPRVVATAIRRQMRQELDLVCSVGAAPVTTVAKIASTMSKPDGLLVIGKEEMLIFLHSLPVSRLSGVGQSTECSLRNIGIVTVGDIAMAGHHRLRGVLGKASASRLLQLANGEEVRALQTTRESKSIGSEVTFESDLPSDSDQLVALLRSESAKLARRLRSKSLSATSVAIKVRFSDFTTVSRSITLAAPSHSEQEIWDAAARLWQPFIAQRSHIRLLGVRVEQLQDNRMAGEQLSLADIDQRQSQTDAAKDAVIAKFGPDAIRSASDLRTNPPDR